MSLPTGRLRLDRLWDTETTAQSLTSTIPDNMSSQQDTGRSYHLKCTGDALSTAQAHGSPNGITLFGSCFCPFVQRVWVTLEHLGIDYMVSPSVAPSWYIADMLIRMQYCGLLPHFALSDSLTIRRYR